MKQVLSAMFIAVLGALTLVQAQQTPPVGKCSLTLAQSPEIRSLRLGMSPDEVLKLFPGSREDPNVRNALSSANEHFGVARFGITNPEYLPKPKFANVNLLVVEFLDNRLSKFKIEYSGPEWKSDVAFIAKLSEAFNLPRAEEWERSKFEAARILTCVGFEIQASAHFRSGWVRVSTLDADQIMKNRQEEAKEKARREFKP